MAEALTVTLSAQDNISPALAQIAANSNAAMDSISRMGSTGGSAMDSVADSMRSAVDALNAASSGVRGFSNSMDEIADAAGNAAGAAEDWAEADRLASQAAEQLHMSLEAAPEAAQKLADAMRDSEEAISALSNEQQEAVRANEEYQAAAQEAEAALQAQQEAFDAAEQAAREYDEAMRAGVESTEQLESMAEKAMHAGEELAEANGRAAEAADRLRGATEGAIADVTDIGEESEEAARGVDDLADGVRDLLETFGLAVGLTEFLNYLDQCIQKSAEFEQALAKVSTIADTSRTSMDAIRSDIMALSIETGDSAASLTEAAYQAISASVDTADAVDFVAQASQLAAAGFTEQSTAVDILSTALNAYGLEATEVEHVSDMLITTQNLGKTSVGELAQSMGRVIPLAAAYGVEMDNLAAGYAELTKGGIATAEATTYMKGMFNELGSTSSEVSQILQEMTGSTFTQLMEQGASLGDVMQILGDSVNGDATAFANLWSSQEAGVGALALYNSGAQQFNAKLSQMQSSAGATAAAYDTMNNTMADSLEDMGNAFDNLGIAIGDALEPLVSFGVGVVTDFVNWLTQMANACPAVTAGITAAGVAAGIAAVAFQVFGNGVMGALGPIGWIAAAVGGVITLCTALANSVDEDVKKYEEASASSKVLANEMNSLQSEYDALVESVGEEAAAQSELAAQLDVARTAYEGTYQTLEQFVAQTEAAVQSSEELLDSISEQRAQLAQQDNTADAYIDKLVELAGQSDLTASDMAMMDAMLGKLKERFPEVTATTNDFIQGGQRAAEAIRQQTKAAAEAAATNAYAQMLADTTEQEALLTAQIELSRREEEAYQELLESGDGYLNIDNLTDEYLQAQDATASLVAEQKKLQTTQKALAEIVTEQEEAQRQAAQAALDSVAAMNEEDAAAVVAGATYEAFAGQIMEIAQKHDELAQSISDAVDSQISSFQRFEADSGQSIANATANIQASIETMRAQTENVSAVHDYLVNQMHYTEAAAQTILTDMIQPTAEGAGLAADAAQIVQNAAEGSSAAAAQFSEYATSMLQKGQEVDAYGQNMAAVADNMGAQMAQIDDVAKQTIQSLDELPEGVRSKAVDAFTGFTQAIAEAQGPAASAAQTVGAQAGNAASTALAQSGAQCQAVMSGICSNIEIIAASCNPRIVVQVDTSAVDSAVGRIRSLNSGVASVAGHALGTTHAENMFIAGESGPELIIGAGGSTVVPAAETSRMLRGVDDLAQVLGPGADLDLSNFLPSDMPAPVQSAQNGDAGRSGTYNININGSGEITVDAQVSPEKVVDILSENLRPLLLDIVKQEVYEEGNRTYAF